MTKQYFPFLLPLLPFKIITVSFFCRGFDFIRQLILQKLNQCSEGVDFVRVKYAVVLFKTDSFLLFVRNVYPPKFYPIMLEKKSFYLSVLLHTYCC